MSRGPPLLENPRLGWALVVLVGLVFAALALSGLQAWQAAGLHVLALSLCAYVLFAWDKRRAAASKRRIAEANLWTILLLGGAPGAWVGMVRKRHKSKHLSFRLLVPLATVAQVALVVWLALGDWTR